MKLNSWLIGIGLVILFILFWFAGKLVLMLFLAGLVGIALSGLADLLSKYTPLKGKGALLCVILGLTAIFTLAGWLLTPRITEQVKQLGERLPRAKSFFESQIKPQQTPDQANAGILPDYEKLGTEAERGIKLPGRLFSALGTLVNLLVVIIIGMFFAAEPRCYLNGINQLFPPSKRKRVAEIFENIGVTLKRWLFGQFILMTLNGILTSIFLLILGIPLAIALGVFSGLMNFIPSLGPIIALVPAFLIAYVEDPTKALYVLIFYVGYQIFDAIVTTPLVQRKTVSLPPAMILLSQMFFGLPYGLLGVLLAVPITAVIIVLVKMLYIEGVLGERAKIESET